MPVALEGETIPSPNPNPNPYPDPCCNVTLTAMWLQRTGNLGHVIRSLVSLDLFDEFVIWNNNPTVSLTEAHLRTFLGPSVKLVLVNSPENLRDRAKYLACLKASSAVCYYQDDDYLTHSYVASLYANFMRAPTLLHTTTEPFTFYTNLKWSYHNASHGLTSGEAVYITIYTYMYLHHTRLHHNLYLKRPVYITIYTAYFKSDFHPCFHDRFLLDLWWRIFP